MSKTRATLRQEVREHIDDYYDFDTVATGGIDSSATVLPVSQPGRYRAGDTILVESEMMRVDENDEDNSNLTVIRGINETTAAAHSAAATIKIFPEYTDRALNQAINFAIADMYSEISIETVDTTLETDTSTRSYTLPDGFTFVDRIYVQDDNGNYQPVTQWQIIGTQIRFDYNFANNGRTIQLVGRSFQAQLTADSGASGTLTVEDELGVFIVYAAALTALEMRFSHRIKATEYSAAVNDRAGQPNDLLQFAGFLRRRVQEIKDREQKGRVITGHRRPNKHFQPKVYQ